MLYMNNGNLAIMLILHVLIVEGKGFAFVTTENTGVKNAIGRQNLMAIHL